MNQNSDPRHSARKIALSALFSWMFTDTESTESIAVSKELMETSVTDENLAVSIINGVKDNIDPIDRIITKAAPEWPIDKIAKVDLIVLRIAIYELLFWQKTPVKVAIDEAIELSKEFGNDTSHKFVNGVLGTVVDTFPDRIKQ